MYIERNEIHEMVVFDDVCVGDLFAFEDNLYLKISDVSYGTLNCFNFDSNEQEYLDPFEVMVDVKRNAKIVY